MQVKISDRQFAVLVRKIAGKSDKQIADELHIGVRTAKYHAEGLCKALKVGRGAGDLISKFGSFVIQPVWVPNPNAPKLIVMKTRMGWRDVKGKFLKGNKQWRKSRNAQS